MEFDDRFQLAFPSVLGSKISRLIESQTSCPEVIGKNERNKEK